MKVDESIKTLARGANIVFIGIIISKILALAYRAIVARIGVQEYGALSLGLAITSFLITLSLLGLDFGIMRFLPDYHEKKNPYKKQSAISTATVIAGLCSIILAVIVFVNADFLAGLFHAENLAIIMKILAFILPFDVLRIIFFSILKSYKQPKYEIYGKNVIESGIKVILTLLLLMLGFGLMGATLAHAIAIAVSFLASLYFLKHNPIEKISRLIKFNINKEVIIYSLPLVFNALIILIISWADTMLLGIFRTTKEIGLYNAAIPLANLMYVFPNALLIIFLPILTTLHVQKEKESFITLYKTITKWIITFNIAILIAFLILKKEILIAAFGQEYASASLACIILSIGNLLYYAALTSNNVLLTLKKTKYIFLISAIGAGSNILLNLYMIPKYGFLGAAITTLFSQLIMAIMLYAKSKSLLESEIFTKEYWKILFAGLLTYGISSIVYNKLNALHPYISIPIITAIIVIIYAVTLNVLKYINEEEKILLRFIREKYHVKIPLFERFIRR